MSDIPPDHRPEGTAPSLTAYSNHGCRCEGCRAENAAKARARRADPSSATSRHDRAMQRARTRALKIFREDFPEEWAEIVAEEREAEGLPRRRRA